MSPILVALVGAVAVVVVVLLMRSNTSPMMVDAYNQPFAYQQPALTTGRDDALAASIAGAVGSALNVINSVIKK